MTGAHEATAGSGTAGVGSGMASGGSPGEQALLRYLLRLGDTSLVLGQRLGEWIGHAPALEEDLGLGVRRRVQLPVQTQP